MTESLVAVLENLWLAAVHAKLTRDPEIAHAVLEQMVELPEFAVGDSIP